MWLRTWKVIVPVVGGVLLLLGFWDDIAKRIRPTPKPVPAETPEPPAKPLEDSVDLNALERRYPFGFVVFRNNKADSRFEDIQRGVIFEVDWEKARVATVRDSVLMHIPVKHLYIKQYNMTINNTVLSFGFANTKTGTVRDLGKEGTLKLNDISTFFEVVSDHPRRPIYVFGFGPFRPD